MSKARAKKPPAQPAEEPISYEAFARRMLAAWDQPVSAGDTCTTPKDAAGRAAFASTVGTTGRGTVLVRTPDASAANEVLGFLKSFFTDEPKLAALLKKQAGDTLTLTGGVNIVVTTDPTRRPNRLLANITLEPEAAALENVNTRDLTRSLICLAVEGHPAVPELEQMIGAKPGTLLAVHTRLWERAKAESNAARQAQRAALPRMSNTSVPIVARSHERLQAPQIRLDGLPQRKDGRPQPRILRRRDQQ